MTTLGDIIQQGLRDGNIIPIGSTPTAAEVTEGLKRLQVIISSVLGNEAGEGLSPFAIGDNNINTAGWVPSIPTYVPLNVRLVCNLTAAQTLYLHPQPQDGSRLAIIDASGNFATYNLTLNGNGYLVAGGTTDVRTTNGEAAQYFYRADLGDWIEITTLDDSDDMPFPEEFDDMFIVLLAMRLNPRNAQQVSQESMLMMERSRDQFRARYSQTIPTPADMGVLRRPVGRLNINNGWML